MLLSSTWAYQQHAFCGNEPDHPSRSLRICQFLSFCFAVSGEILSDLFRIENPGIQIFKNILL